MDENLKKSLECLPIVGRDVFDHVKKQAYRSGEDNALVEIVEIAILSLDPSVPARNYDIAAVMGVNADKDLIYYINVPNSLTLINGKMHAEAVPADISMVDVKNIKAYETLKSYLR